jgi:hypothetical protein
MKQITIRVADEDLLEVVGLLQAYDMRITQVASTTTLERPSQAALEAFRDGQVAPVRRRAHRTVRHTSATIQAIREAIMALPAPFTTRQSIQQLAKQHRWPVSAVKYQLRRFVEAGEIERIEGSPATGYSYVQVKVKPETQAESADA